MERGDELDKAKFSLFLDFDGVLNDTSNISNILKFGGLLASKHNKKIFNEESIEALNFLISSLSSNYEIKLVLTTFWRMNLDKCIDMLRANGLQFDGEYDAIPFIVHKTRIKKIEEYIDSHDIKKFCVIDDLPYFKKHFDPNNLIHTSILSGALNKSKIESYLEKFHPDTSQILE